MNFIVDLSQFGLRAREEKISGKLKIRDFEFKIIGYGGEIIGSSRFEKEILAHFPMERYSNGSRIQARLTVQRFLLRS